MPIRVEPTRNHLPDPALIPEAPPAVLEAAKAAREAGDTLTAAESDLRDAEAAVGQADAADQTADRKALAEGGKMPGPKGPKAREAVEAARRRLAAAEANFQEAAANLVPVIQSHRDEWMATIEEMREQAAAAVVAALDVYRGASLRIGELDQTKGAVDGFEKSPSNPWAGGGFNHSSAHRRRRDGAAYDRERAEGLLRARRRFQIEHEIGQVLVELEHLATGAKPWTEDPTSSRTLSLAKSGGADFSDNGLGFLLEYQERARVGA
jgi:hypothetical protein